MNQSIQNQFIKDTIAQSLKMPPESLGEDFQQVAWNLPRWHLLMLQDRPRLQYYSDIIKPKVKDKIVLDVGTGSGILSYLALKWGAKKVYSVEKNPALQAVYHHLMQEHLESGRAELICDDAHFISVWQTSTPSESITLPLRSGFNYDFTVDWGDSTKSKITSFDDANAIHVYSDSG